MSEAVVSYEHLQVAGVYMVTSRHRGKAVVVVDEFVSVDDDMDAIVECRIVSGALRHQKNRHKPPSTPGDKTRIRWSSFDWCVY